MQLEQTSNTLVDIRSFLLGAVEKIGILPGLIATVLAISKVADSTGVTWFEMLSISMLGLYMFMFSVTEASLKTKRLAQTLKTYLTVFRDGE